MEPEKQKKKTGRPPKGKRGRFTFRVTGVLRDHLEEAAELSGRSVSEEIEHRLDQTLSFDQIIGDQKSAQLVRQVIACIDMAQQFTGHKWYADEKAKRALATALSELVEPRAVLNYPIESEKQSPEEFGATIRHLVAGLVSPFRAVMHRTGPESDYEEAGEQQKADMAAESIHPATRAERARLDALAVRLRERNLDADSKAEKRFEFPTFELPKKDSDK